MTVNVLGKDIELYESDLQFSANQDFSVVEYTNNLKQAIINRIKTIKGEYSVTSYGSEVYRVIGKPRNSVLKSQLTGYIVETLNQEPRVQEVQSVIVEFDENDKFKVNLSISILPISSQVSLNLIFPLFLNS